MMTAPTAKASRHPNLPSFSGSAAQLHGRACRLGRAAAVVLALLPSEVRAADDPAQPSLEELSAEGEGLYRYRCAKCHGREGEGQQHSHDAAPRLGGRFARLSVSEISVQVIRGGSYMPPFGSLSDREIAAIATYVRTAFGNQLGMVTEAEVAAYR